EVAVDAVGNIYFSTLLEAGVFKVTSEGAIYKLAISGMPTNFHSNGIAVDLIGNLYLAGNGPDYSEARVWKVTPDGTATVFAGTGRYGDFGDGGPATAATLHMPMDLAVDAEGSVYIADSLDRVRKVTPDGIISTVAGNGTYDDKDDVLATTTGIAN